MLKKFKVGDRVVCSSEPNVRGLVGTVFKVCSFNYDVIWDGLTTGHDGEAGDGSNNHWYVTDADLKPYIKVKTATTKYKVGDVVTVRDDLRYNWYKMSDGTNVMYTTDQMLTKRGKKVKIKSITKTGRYMIEGSIFPWVDEMFEEKVETKPKTKVTEEKREPKVGDRIKMIADYCSAEKGMTGIIKHFGSLNIAVEFDKPFVGGHSCCNYCKSDRGQWVKRDQFVVISDSTPRLVCQVTFEKGSQMYSYLTEDTSITVGSEVTVPCGKGDHETTATVQRIGYYTEADTPYPFDKMKTVVGKGEITKAKFKVGDIVRAIVDSPYANTCKKYQWEGEVIAVGTHYFRARTTYTTKGKSYIGVIYDILNFPHFELCK